jgi:hypothetical protein
MINFEKILITPTKAKELLEANTDNRRIKQPVVLKYAKDMIEGRWLEDTGETIKIAKSGRILDGQHRLHAIIKANKAIYCHISNGLDESVFKVIDTGTTRNATDVFKIEGIKNENKLPSIISFFNLLEAGKKHKSLHVNEKSTNAMLLEQYYEDENFWQSVSRNAFNWYICFAKILTPAFIGGFYAHFYKLNSDKANLFMVQLTSGINVENETILLLRNKLIADKVSIKKMPQNLKMALFIKTWNSFITGKTIKFLKFDSTREEYPKAIGSVNELQYEEN